MGKESIIFAILDLIVGCVLIIVSLISFGSTFQGVIISIYLIFFGAVIIIAVFIVPGPIKSNCEFYWKFIGRGLWFLFLGCLILGPHDFHLFAGIFTLIVAFLYILLWILNFAGVTSVTLPEPLGCPCGSGGGGSSSSSGSSGGSNKSSKSGSTKKKKSSTKKKKTQN